MATQIRRVTVPTQPELQQAVQSYIAQGFSVQQQTDDSVTMFKKKEFSILWAVVGFVLCIIPLLIYLIVYASESDEMVIINIGDPTTSAAPLDASLKRCPHCSKVIKADAQTCTYCKMPV
jgi:hypothetical protein